LRAGALFLLATIVIAAYGIATLERRSPESANGREEVMAVPRTTSPEIPELSVLKSAHAAASKWFTVTVILAVISALGFARWA
jgi:hypothetical protein